MASILDGLGLEGLSLMAMNGPHRQPEKWFAITRGLIQQTIAEMDLDPAALAEVEEAFIGLDSMNSLVPAEKSLTAPYSLSLTPICAAIFLSWATRRCASVETCTPFGERTFRCSVHPLQSSHHTHHSQSQHQRADRLRYTLVGCRRNAKPLAL